MADDTAFRVGGRSSRARDVKSEIRNLVDPLAVFGNENRQFFHHELSFANGANHVGAGRGVPFLRHFLAGMAAPTLDVGVTGENMAIDFRQLAIV